MNHHCVEHQAGDFTVNQWVGLKDDKCTVDIKERESAASCEYLLSNFRPCGDCGASKARDVASKQPQMQISDGVGWVSAGGCKVDDDSKVRLGGEMTNPRIINQLFERPYLTVPYMGNGCYYPDKESRLIQSEQTGEKRSCNVLSGVTIDNYFTPMLESLKKDIQDPRLLIEETNGWVRGGVSTRKNLKDIDYKRVCLSSIKNRVVN